MFLYSVKDFKDKCYIVRHESEAEANSILRRVVMTDDEGRRVLDKYGEVGTRITSVFPFKW